MSLASGALTLLRRARIPPDSAIRVVALCRYGGLAPGSFVTTPDEFGGTDVGVAPAQPSYVTTIFSQLFGVRDIANASASWSSGARA